MNREIAQASGQEHVDLSAGELSIRLDLIMQKSVQLCDTRLKAEPVFAILAALLLSI
ncbi:MAG: hypothetical protein ABL961_11585 [Vicinamibacterales bacterium]